MQAFMQFWENIAYGSEWPFTAGGMILFWLIEGYYPCFVFLEAV